MHRVKWSRGSAFPGGRPATPGDVGGAPVPPAGPERSPGALRLEHRWNTSLERRGLLWTSTDSAVLYDFRFCREIVESARWTRLTRNDGVPGSSPGRLS